MDHIDSTKVCQENINEHKNGETEMHEMNDDRKTNQEIDCKENLNTEVSNSDSFDLQEFDDEDIILPNSPLADYMRDFNLLDAKNLTEKEEVDQSKNYGMHFNVNDNFNRIESKNYSHSAVQESNQNTTSDRKNFNYFTEIKIFFKNLTVNIINCIYSVFFCHIFLIENFLVNYSLERDEVNILTENDRAFVSLWKSEQISTPSWILFRMSAVIFASLMSFVLFSFEFFNFGENIISAILLDIHSFLPYILFVNFLLMLYIFFELLLCFMFYFYLKSLMCNMKMIFLKIKKSIRLIQEAELVARGFTSASVCPSAERIELSQNLPIVSARRQYLEFRKQVFNWIKDLFMEYRLSTSTLINQMSKDIDIGFTDDYLAKLDIHEFGCMFKYDINSESECEELMKVTENLSISSLKAMFHLMEIQVSEFFKCLYSVSTMYAEEKFKNNYSFPVFEFFKRLNILFNLFGKVKQSLKIIEIKYKYYRCFEAMDVKNNKSSPPHASETSGVSVAIHNMSLHLKSALWRVLEIEDFVSTNNLNANSLNEDTIKQVNSMLNVVKSEVSGYEEYLNKCNKLFSECLNPKEKIPLDSEIPKIVENKPDVSFSVIERCDIENKIQDEVFEDVISQNYLENEDCEEKFYHQEDFQKNSNLLKELKNVLVIKADEHHTREQIALAKRQKDKGLLESLNEPGESDTLLEQKIENKTSDELCSNEINDDVLKMMKNKISNLETEEFKSKLDSLLDDTLNQPHTLGVKNDSFAAAIASAAAFHRQTLGLTSEEFGCDSSDDTD